MNRIFIIIALIIPPCSAMDIQTTQFKLSDSEEDHILKQRAYSLSSDESELEKQIDNLLAIFSDVTKIEDDQYVKLVLDVLVQDHEATHEHISPYLSIRLRSSYSKIHELTKLRKKSSLKRLMKTLIAESVEEAFIKSRLKVEKLHMKRADSVKKYRYALAGTMAIGLASTLAAFFAAYFAH